jgi:predicted ATPase
LRWGFARRSGEPTLAAQALRDTLEEALALSTVALAPLDVRQMADLVDSLGLTGIDGRAIAERLVRHTGGNPMFALETLKHALATDLRGSQLPRPASVGVLIERRLRQLSAPAIALARVAAVAGVDFSIQLAERVLETPAMALADAWNELETAQILKGAAFAHDLVFEAALRSMPEAIATHTHASIAEWLEQSQGEPARIAAHWEATSTPQRALPWLHQAATRAHAAMRAREAVDFLVRAAAIEADSASPGQAFRTLSSIVDTRFTVDPDPTLLPLLDRLDQLAADVSQKIEALLLRADYFMHRIERLDEGIDAARRAVELATHTGHDWYRVGGGFSVAILQSMQGDYETAARGVNDLLAEARRWPVPRQRCNMLSKAAFVLLRSARTSQAVELYCEAADEARACNYPSSQLIALGNAAHGLLRLQRPREALARLEQSEALRAAHDSLEGSGKANDWKAAIALRLLGRYSEALQRAQLAVERFRLRSPGKLTSAVVTRAHIWLDLGQLARARQDRELALRSVLDPVAAQEVSLLDLRLAVESAAGAENAGDLGSALLEQQLQPFMELQAKLLLIGLATPADAERSARSVIDAARAAEFRGLEAAAMSRAAMAEVETGETEAAVAHSRLAIEMAGQQNTEDLSWIAIVRNAVVVLRQAGLEQESLRLLLMGKEWLEQVAAHSVPPEFRDSFLNRNPVNRELLTLATRLK